MAAIMRKIILLTLAIALGLKLTAQIEGYVYDKNTGEPLAGCYVSVTDPPVATITDANGHFVLQNLPQENVKLEFKFIGYKTVIKDIDLTGDTVQSIKIYMEQVPLRAAEVVVTAFIPGSQHTTAVSIENLDVGDISAFSRPTILGLLEQVPGVDLISKGNGIGTPVIRGLSKTNIVVLNNGFRLEDFQFSENHPFFIDEFGTSRIEIIKGPASLLYGSDAIGGVINVLWEKPALENTFHTDYNLQYHTNTRGWLGSYGAKFSKKGFSTGLRLGYDSNADMTDGTGQQVINSRFLRQNIKGFTILTRKKASYKLFYEYSRDKLGLPVEPAFAMVDDNSRNVKNFYQDLHHFFVGSRNTLFINKQSKLKINFSYERNRRGLAVYDTLPDPIDMDLANYNLDIKQITNHKRYTVLTGFQGNYITNVNYGSTIFLPDHKTLTGAAYFLAKLKLKDINVLTGLRYDNTRIGISFEHYDLGYIDTLMRYSSLSGSLGATYKISENIILRLNTATAYRNPNAAELGENGIHAFRYEVGNLSLQPQRSYEGDLSLHFHKNSFVFDFATYYNRIMNFIYLSPTNEFADNGMRIYTYLQDNALLTGFETGIKCMPVNNLVLSSNYSFIYTRKDDGAPLPLIPQNKIRAKLEYNVSGLARFVKLKFETDGLYAFAQMRPAPGEDVTAPYFLLNGSFLLNFTKTTIPFELQISAHNILDAKYNDHLSTLRESGFYDMGRNISIGIRVSLDRKL